MVDVQMGVQDEAHVAQFHAVASELVLDQVFVELEAAHAQRFHDLVGAVAGVDHDRPGAAEDEEAEREHAARAPAIVPQDEKARLELDVAVVENS